MSEEGKKISQGNVEIDVAKYNSRMHYLTGSRS